MRYFLVCLIPLLLSLLILGCGGGGGGSFQVTVTPPTAPPVAPVLFNIPVKVLDGPIQNARVRLISLQKGKIGQEGITDQNGLAVILVKKTEIDALGTDDSLYFQADNDSAAATVHLTGGQSRNIATGTMIIKSLLPEISQLKQKIQTGINLQSDSEVLKNAILTPFSNAKALLVEASLLESKHLSAPLQSSTKPLASGTSTAYLNARRQVETSLKTAGSDIQAKFKLLAAGMKANLEDGVSSFYQGSTAKSLSESLVEMVIQPKVIISTEFSNAITQVVNRLQLDLTDQNYKDSISDGVTVTDLVQINSNQLTFIATKALSIPVEAPSPTSFQTEGEAVPGEIMQGQGLSFQVELVPQIPVSSFQGSNLSQGGNP